MHRCCALLAVVAIPLLFEASVFAQPPSYRDYRPNLSNYRTRNYRFGGRSDVERLSFELYRLSNAVCWEMHDSYRRNPGYRTAYSEMYEIQQDAKRIYDLAKSRYYRGTHTEDLIVRDLHDMDRRFHQIERDVRGWRADRGDRRGELSRKMDEFEEVLHFMLLDYGVKSKFADASRGPGRRDHGHDHRHDHDRDRRDGYRPGRP